jgi:acyl-CoA thioester hydrolase
MEETRHAFIHDVLGVDIQEDAKQGTNWVLAEYTLKFKASLKRGDKVTVTCCLISIEGSRSKFGFRQEMLRDGKVVAEASFVATCLPVAGGRPFIHPAVVKGFGKIGEAE